MQTAAQGLIIRSVKYGESSLILDVFTDAWGLETFIIGGVRKQKSKHPAALFQLMNWIEFIAYYKENKKIHRIKEVRLSQHYQHLPFELKKRSIGLLIIEILQKVLSGREKHEELYNYLLELFRNLDRQQEKVGNTHIIFLIKLASFLGFEITNNYSQECVYFEKSHGQFVDHPNYKYGSNQEISELLHQLLSSSHILASDVKLNRRERNEIVHELCSFYKLHIERFKDLKTLGVLQELLE